MIHPGVVRHVRLKRLRHSVGDGFYAVCAEADRAGAADALEVLYQRSTLLPWSP